MHKVLHFICDVNHLQAVAFLNTYGNTVNVKSEKLNDRPRRLTFFIFRCEIGSVDIDPCICQKNRPSVLTPLSPTPVQCHRQVRRDPQICPQTHQNSKRVNCSIVDLLGGSQTIRTSVSADIFKDETNAGHHPKEGSDNDSNNNGISATTSTPPRVGKSKVATTTPKMVILFNQSEDIKVVYFGCFEFLYSQRAHSETFGGNPMICPDTPTKQDKP